MTEPAQRLDLFKNSNFERGASKLTELIWMMVQAWFFGSWLPGSGWRVRLLRAFGATIGQGVVIKPHVTVKFPWRLKIGSHVWIGERVWIDNLAQVTLCDHACISQGAYLCTGSHDWSAQAFTLVTKPIFVGKGAWVGARSSLAPGAVLGDGAILAMGSLGRGRIPAMTVHRADGKSLERQLHTSSGKVAE
ncbi:WcaF family extracellular polysaccharide biosynthesis acetyltransferase [Salipiger marinus]|uniref:WcaF family extracellular polysaccharide biosynthesis acetyltransferase n=1 Tax=Salipiger marinus TaxID=555512 RepID=UPI002BDF6379|nr:WcaF family extracellular polysaccharide biosynthesis acetyltransferase [Salipiger manganoxidans]MEB3421669.1 WcaF family extracellular polysaccharide biosynthesis acetyltransferase [Salipiger manganoxidans]